MIGSVLRFTLRSTSRKPFLPHPAGILCNYHKGFVCLNEVEDNEKTELLKEQTRRRSRRIRVFNKREPDVAPIKTSTSTSIQKIRIIQQLRKVMNDKFVNVLFKEIEDEQQGINLVDVELNDLKEDIAQKFLTSDENGKNEVTLQLKSDLPQVQIMFRINDIAKDYTSLIKLKRQWFLRDKQKERSKHLGENPLKIKVVKEGVTKGRWSIEEEQLKDIEGDEVGINFQVKLSTHTSINQNQYLQLSCIGGNSGMIIRKIDVIDPQTNKIVSKSRQFHNLPYFLQKAWYEYLSNHFNIDYNLALFVLAYSNEKEQKEYLNWLGSILEYRTQSL
eukprot:gene4692-5028_t